MKLDHKPAKKGFVCYVLTSHGGLVHDWIMHSSQQGLEGVPEGISLDLATRTTRKRKRGTIGATADNITLPALKSIVYILCERVTAAWRRLQYICFVDNLFVDVNIARALLAINIGICGTTRKNAPGIPPILLAIQHRFSKLLPDNAVTSCIVDGLVNCMVWHDGLRKNWVSFITSVHRPGQILSAFRRSKHMRGTRTTPQGFTTVYIEQPAAAVDYNTYMGSTDANNQLRGEATVRIARQLKWTKKFLEFLIDICHTNAYLIWKRELRNQRTDERERDFFLQELITGLLYNPEDVHRPTHLKTRRYCGWSGCQPREYNRRQVLVEVRNSEKQSRPSRTTEYCETCMKVLCIGIGCWQAYHEAYGLPVGSQERR